MSINGAAVPSFPHNILIVEDEPATAGDLQSKLQRLGYEQSGIAPSGEEAVHMAGVRRPDLVLMDACLANGVIDGIEVVRKLREIADVPVIYMAARSESHTLKRARARQPHDYILKPVQIRALESAIEVGIYRHSMEKNLRKILAWLDEAIRSIAGGVIASDSVERINISNPGAAQYLGILLDSQTCEKVRGQIEAAEIGRFSIRDEQEGWFIPASGK